MLFNKSMKWDFPPEVVFSDNSKIEYLSETKLLGVIVSDNLKWHNNTLYICQKARAKLWLLRRMVKLKLDIYKMFDVYCKEVRCMLELAVPVWHSGLTLKETADIERIQKVAFRIILREQYISYQQACSVLSSPTLEQRRETLCLKFGRKNLKSDRPFFTKIKTRSLVQEYKCRTERLRRSDLPYLAELLIINKKHKARK